MDTDFPYDSSECLALQTRYDITFSNASINYSAT